MSVLDKDFDREITYKGFDKSYKEKDEFKWKDVFEEAKNSDKKILVERTNSIGLTQDIIKQMPENVYIRIIGGFTDEYISGFGVCPKSTGRKLREKVTYEKNELIGIINIFERIEEIVNKNPEWDDLDKALFVYEYLKKKIRYRDSMKVSEKEEGGSGIVNRGRRWDSLTGLLCEMSTCSGYSFIYQEILTRLGIKCVSIGSNNHAYNFIEINGEQYLIDIIQDSMLYEENGEDITTGFGFDSKDVSRSGYNYNTIKNKNLIKGKFKIIPEDEITRRRLKIQKAVNEILNNRNDQLGDPIQNK